MSNASFALDRVVAFALDHPWAITRPMLSVVTSVLAQRLAGVDRHQALDLVGPRPPVPTPVTRGAAIIPIHGVIAPRMNLLSDISGGTTFEGLTVDLREAVQDPTVGTIVLDVDSPGGSCAGATVFADQVRKARAVKPVVAVAQYSCCSAAYWVASNATQVVAAPGSQVGSIGVFTMHEDLSKMLADLGVHVSTISAGKYKAETTETQPLSDEARARIQKHVDHTYGTFVRDVALGRGIAEATVRAGYGEGAVVLAEDALTLGMVDKIETLDETIARVTGSAAAPAFATAQERDTATAQERRRLHAEIDRAVMEWALD